MTGRVLAAIVLALLVAACGSDEQSQCVDETTLRDCQGGDCETVQCRGDEACHEAACVDWTDVSLTLDFELSYDPGNPQRVICEVSEGGFPRSRVESLRFDFGDGFAGYGERIGHTYLTSGVYPVDLQVRLSDGRVLHASRLAQLPNGAGDAQPSVQFTVNKIPEQLNGSLPFTSDNFTPKDPGDDMDESFQLLLPRHGFTVDLTMLDTGSGSVDQGSLSLTADVPLAGGTVPAGTELADRLQLINDGANDRVSRARWTVGADDAFPDGVATLTLAATDSDGNTIQRSLAFQVVEMTPERDPFGRNMVWLFRLDTDFFTTTATISGAGNVDMTSTQQANGEPDFIEELTLIGAQGSDAVANAIYLDWVMNALIAETYRYFHMAPDGAPLANIAFTIVAGNATGAPDPASFSPTGTFSMMRFGGTFNGFVGFSDYSARNLERSDDSTAGRGVASVSILGQILAAPVLTEPYDPIKPGIGTPVGEHDWDALVLASDYDPNDPGNPAEAQDRYADLVSVARFIALPLAAVAAHEMGHAMGLMPNGAPPEGFFGNRGDASFIGAEHTNSHHADLPGLNLMQAGGDPFSLVVSALGPLEYPSNFTLIDLLEMVANENKLSPYSLAYFNRQLTYGTVLP